ncbi:MAG: N-acetyltransferase [Bacteroidetes bacterium]|nr:N-acetyltransferase [Bacteroidota bacterium]
MHIIERITGKRHTVVIEPVVEEDYKTITKRKYFFNWKTEKKHKLYKLRRGDSDIILGLISMLNEKRESRIEIRLLAVSVENRGKNRQYERIAGTLIGYACREAMKCYGTEGCVSLVPKTELKKHYINQYGMMDAGKQIFLAGLPLLKILNTYEDENN